MTFFGRLVSRYALFGLEVPAGKAANILVTNVMPKIVDFFDEQLKDKNGKISKLILHDGQDRTAEKF